MTSVPAALAPVPFDPDLDSEGALVRAAGPVLEQLEVDLTGAPVGVVLTDERGHVLDRRATDPSAAVNGDEHVVNALTACTSAAAPIADPRTGRVIGAIDLTSLARNASALMLLLATRAAGEIEQRLSDHLAVAERLLLQRFLQERRRAKGPLVFLTRTAMIPNASADRLLGPGDEALLREWASRPSGSGTADLVSLSGGVPVTIRAEPLVAGGTAVGTVLRLKPVRNGGSGASRRCDRPTFGWDSLTGAESSVLDLVAEGLTNREVAERLFLSHHTVGFHLRSIFSKLGVRSRVELTRLAVERN